MSYKVLYTSNFAKELKALAKKYRSIKDDLSTLIDDLGSQPIQGDEIFKNCYKIRLAIKSKGKGKSSGARVITYVHIQGEEVFLVSIFDKSEKETINDAELKRLLNLAGLL
ncbi:type II toxin-antitoxin system RelE/ParE family toxin [Mucilaginibacter daejeonensis]|uniref:type II toxin-antitoxin system RelE family toxin n=1 Tax=Mucilaginibacter daejeonensis TaxID=398049 RepID=UPI001D173690|nr:type II toxin-antitoxin system RelE/ParE family toxin [Mucilaginibacter daejeonensis]UEG53529.1 type II toxin-antitoxin system RelE/ParE family toxin [Mucilaginibacter daejeonensis]